GVEGADPLALDRVGLVDERRTSAEVDGRRYQRFVHRHQRVAVAADAAAIPQRLPEGLAQADADVLDGVVRVYLDVTGGLDLQVEQAVLGERFQHVVEERHGRGDLAHAGPVEGHRELDLGLAGLALYRGRPRLRHAFWPGF